MQDTRKRYPTRIGSILNGIFQQRNFTPRMTEAKVFTVWDDAVGEGVARHAQPERLSGTTLHVIVSNSVWKQELHFMEGLIVDKVNARVGKKTVGNLSFRVGAVERQHPEAPRPSSPVTVVLDEERIRVIEKEFKDFSDAELKEVLMALRIKDEKAKKASGKK